MTTDKRINETQIIVPSGVKRTPAYTIYKPNRNGNGGAVSFHFNQSKQAIFVEAANQSGDKRFDWENKIIMKWSLTDLGTILAGLRNNLPQTKLFHQTEKANSACALNYSASNGEKNDDSRPPFRLTISRQENRDRSVAKVSITLTLGEVAILETALKNAIGSILEW